MKVLFERRPSVFVAPEFDGVARDIGVLSTALSGSRLILPLGGAPYVATFAPLGWSKVRDLVNGDEAHTLVQGEESLHALALRFWQDAEDFVSTSNGVPPR